MHNGMKGAGCYESVAPGEPITLTQRPSAGSVTGGEVPSQRSVSNPTGPLPDLSLRSAPPSPPTSSPPQTNRRGRT